jgi:mono/diheme cytochrome c family protein
MRKFLKWIGIILGALIVLLVLTVGTVYAVSTYRFNRTYEVQVEQVEIPTDQASIEYGEHVASIRSCIACHGDDLAGQIEFEDPMVGRIANANLTSGVGGVGAAYSDDDWVRAIRHGLTPEGKPILIMPAHTMYPMSDEDLGAVIAYLKNIPPVNKERLPVSLSLLPRVMYLTGQMDFLVAAELIDHDGPRPAAPERGVTAEYGAYLAGLCTVCHGAGLSGGQIPGTPPSDPPARNLTPAGRLKNWTLEEFVAAMRTGSTPDGGQLRDQYMPYSIFVDMTDEELEAIWLYLGSLPPTEYGNR